MINNYIFISVGFVKMLTHNKLGIIVIFLSVLYSTNSVSQSCGTYVLPNQIQLESTIAITPLTSTESLPQINKNFSIAFYVVRDSLNNNGITSGDLDMAINMLNSAFQSINLQFHICSINYVNNYQYDYLTSAKEPNLTNEYSTKDVINIYVTTVLYDQFQNGVKGYSYMPASGKDFIFIEKEYLTKSELIHQMGHFFNLYHTHETIFGGSKEQVARVDCETTGDLCCDTEADPNLIGVVNSSCIYTGTSWDQNSVVYSPSVKNIMSYAPDDCRCYFSKTQLLRVIYAVKNLKNNLR